MNRAQGDGYLQDHLTEGFVGTSFSSAPPPPFPRYIMRKKVFERGRGGLDLTMVFIKMCSAARFDKKERAEAGCLDGFLMSPDNFTRLAIDRIPTFTRKLKEFRSLLNVYTLRGPFFF